ncbi:MAG: hypothetical protein JSS35_14090, partial [Proteobacteria bacterium]|nr:hypothetical protein [Pseudomonadota bacterium]
AGLYVQLRRERLEAFARATVEMEAAKKVRVAYADLLDGGVERLQAAAQTGIGLGACGKRVALEKDFAPVIDACDGLERGVLPGAETVAAVCTAFAGVLSRNANNLEPPAPNADASRILEDLQGRFILALKRADREADLELSNLDQRYGDLVRNATPRATRLGDARASAERYSRDRYGVEFDFIWPRIALLRPKRDDDPVAEAQIQADFAVNSLFVAGTVPLVWLPLLTILAGTPWLFLFLAAAGPLACAALYEMAVVTQARLGEVVKGVIDQYRLAVLISLNQELPATLFSERKIWNRLQLVDDGGDGRDLIYRYD